MTDVVEKPWGWYQNLYDCNYGYKVKRLHVYANQKISLQYHLKRTEHWIVVEGEGTVTISNEQREVQVGSYIFIPKKTAHRIHAGNNGIMIVEIQQGILCVENDIVRLEDDYNRV